MIEYIIATFIIGFSIGMFIDRKFFKNGEMNTDDCLEYLREKGYYTNVNILPKKEGK